MPNSKKINLFLVTLFFSIITNQILGMKQAKQKKGKQLILVKVHLGAEFQDIVKKLKRIKPKQKLIKSGSKLFEPKFIAPEPRFRGVWLFKNLTKWLRQKKGKELILQKVYLSSEFQDLVKKLKLIKPKFERMEWAPEILPLLISSIKPRSIGKPIRLKLEIEPELVVEKGLDTTSVFMWSGKCIEMVSTSDKAKDKSIFSFGFCGCTGVGCFALYKNGQQRAFLTHYPPMPKDLDPHIPKIKSLCCELNKGTDKNPIVKSVIIIMHPGAWKKNVKTGCWDEMVPEDPKHVDTLVRTVQESLSCKNVVVKKELYSAIEMIEIGGAWQPGGMFDGKIVPKGFEIVLSKNPKNSYFQSKATNHTKQKFLS
ncbi:hypothetical protein ACFLYU_01560 [Candidatus Dependentiae bacterium]